jgi:putative hydrolase of the HAD superfamily
MEIKHIFFDLDHTLWDFEKNSNLTFKQLFEAHQLEIELEAFLAVYSPINFEYWKKYREERVSKEDLRYGRLKDTFDALNFNMPEELIHQLSYDYIAVLPCYNHLFEGVFELLDYLTSKYTLHIITNGFEEVQNLKLEKSGIIKYFDKIITSESVGVKKPNPRVFMYALDKVGATAENSIMVGDNLEADIIGALNCGITSIHFNLNDDKFEQKKYISVSSLLEIKQYL